VAEKVVTIEDSTITALLSNQKLTEALPGLKTAGAAKVATTSCKPCQAKARAKSVNYSQVKKAIGTLTGEQRKKLKEALGADKVRVTFKNDAGKMVQLTF
jgi:uncharacterized protein YajQ (UPF0234 family)